MTKRNLGMKKNYFNIFLASMTASLVLVVASCGSPSTATAGAKIGTTALPDMKAEATATPSTKPVAEITKPTTSTTYEAFSSVTVGADTAIEDTKTKLQWVNSSPGCKPYSPGMNEEAIKTSVTEYCSSLSFLGQNDWRVPISKELSLFLQKANKYNETLYYKNAGCPRLISIDSGKVMTANTHNTPPVGTLNPWEDKNAGIRCVRDNM